MFSWVSDTIKSFIGDEDPQQQQGEHSHDCSGHDHSHTQSDDHGYSHDHGGDCSDHGHSHDAAPIPSDHGHSHDSVPSSSFHGHSHEGGVCGGPVSVLPPPVLQASPQTTSLPSVTVSVPVSSTNDEGIISEPKPMKVAAQSKDNASLYKEAMLTREHLIPIFARFNALVNTPEGKQRLKNAVTAGRSVDEEASEMQKEIAIELGIDGQFALDCFKKVVETYRFSDPNLVQQFMTFVQIESLACDEAELPPDEFARKVAMIRMQKAQQAKMQQSFSAMTPEQQQSMMRMQANMAAMMQQQQAQGVDFRAAMMQRVQQMQQGQQGIDPNLSPEERMKLAMEKLSRAQQAIQDAGLNQADVLAQAMKVLTTGGPLPQMPPSSSSSSTPPTSSEDKKDQ